MSTLLIKRANRVVLLSVAAIMVVSLLAPLAAIANTDLAPGDSAVVSSPGGANLRVDTSLADESIIAELPAGTTVWVSEGPYYEDTGVWVYVATDGYGPGFVTTALLSRIGNDELAEANGVAVEEPAVVEEEAQVVTSEYAWLEPIDSLVVVDHNLELTEQGLPVLVDAYHGAPVLGYVQVGGALDVTSGRTENNFVRVNFNGVGAFVDGSFVELDSEYVEEPAVEEEVVWLDEPVEEEAPVEDAAPEEPVVEEPVAEEEAPVEDAAPEETVVEEPVAEEEAPVEDAAPEESVVEEPVAEEEAPVEDAAPEESVVEEPVAEEEAPVEDAAPEEPVVEEEIASGESTPELAQTEEAAETEEATEEVAETEEATEEVAETEEATEEVAETEEATEEVAETEEATEEVAETEEATEEVAETEEATEEVVVTEEATEEVVVTEEATEEVVVTEEATEEVVETEEATEAEEEAQAVEDAPIATTADAFDADAMIGSATVTGTTSGLLCRADASPSAPVLMTLSEGTKVLVSAEPVNGYLGIDCGGLQGFADVNYLWSGGAGDEEITSSRMDVVVTGTGNGLNCRTGAGLSHSVITTLGDGTSLVTRGAASNGWTPVTCAGQNGFVYTTWIEVANGSGNAGSDNSSNVSSGNAVVNTGGDGLYCRTGAGTSYGIITVLRHGSSVAVRGAQQGDWVPVTCGGAAGFSHASYLNVSSSGSGSESGSDSSDSGNSTPTGAVTVANTGGMGLNCRTGAGTSNSIITTLALGQTVQTRSGSTNGWTAVICGGTNGFVSSEFVSGGSAGTTPSEPAPSKPKPEPSAPSGMGKGDHGKTTANLNLRYSASLSSSVSTTVDPGKVVLITGSLSNNYYPVDYDGLTGFMHKDYLVQTSEALSERGGSAQPEPSKPDPAPDPAPKPGNGSATGNAMVDYAMRYLGYPYVWATRGPASFDCSGFTYWVTLNVTGQNIGAGTWTQVSAGTPVSKANLQPGDLVFFQNTYTAGLSHVGLYIGNGQFIHAQNEATGVVISDLDSSYYGPRWYGAVRL